MNLWRRRHDVRTRLLAIVLLALAVALGAATYGFNVLFAHTTSRDADALLRDRATSELSVLEVVGGHVRVRETRDDVLADALVWIFDGSKLLESPQAPPATDAAARRLARGPGSFLDVESSKVRLFGMPIADRGRRVGAIVTGISVAPYEQTERTALIGSLALAASLLVVVGLAVYWLLRSALQPVARMTTQAAAWSEHDPGRRFAVGEPHDELTRLAATLDGLLDRLAATLRHERHFSAELSHELRTPLAKVIAEAELTLRRDRAPEEYREALSAVLRNAQQVARIVEALVAAAQQQAGPAGTADAYEVASEVVEHCRDLAAQRNIEITLAEPRVALRVGADADLLQRMLHPVVENACRYGRHRVDLFLARRNGAVAFAVQDDGPGLDPAERETIFEPGRRGTAGRGGEAGAGLGLALARRLARSAAGDVEAQVGAGGARFVLTLPPG